LSVVSRNIDKIGFYKRGIRWHPSEDNFAQNVRDGQSWEAQQHFYPIGSSMEDAFLRTLMENNCMNTAVLIDGEPFRTTGRVYRKTEADMVHIKATLQDILTAGLDTERDEALRRM
jgi:hypothetical protein